MKLKLITEEGLENIANHKYQSGQYTWLDNKLGYLWEGLCKLFPRSVAPNMITLIGTMAIYLSTFILYIYGPEFENEKPKWVYIFSVICIFLY